MWETITQANQCVCAAARNICVYKNNFLSCILIVKISLKMILILRIYPRQILIIAWNKVVYYHYKE